MKNTLALSLCTLLLLLLIQPTMDGQIKRQKKSIFGLSAMLGANLTQVDGDNFAGFDKLGVTAGLKGIIELNESFHLNIELIYSEKGSRFESKASFARGTKDRAIKLSYAEIPLLLVYRLKPPDATTTYSFEVGVSMARLLDSEIQEPDIKDPSEFDFSEIKEDFEGTEFNAVLGVHINPAGDWGLGLRYSGALSKFYENPDPVFTTGQREAIEFLRNFQITGLLTYRF